MTGLHLTPEAVQARRLELATVEEQIRALGRRKSVLRAEILSGYAAPVKGVPAEQLPLAETATATQPPEAPAQAPEAAKPATATTTATPLRDRVRAALGAAKVRRSAKVLATLLGESEEDVADELEGLELAREVIGKNTSGKASRAYELRNRWEAKRGTGRDTKPGKGRKKGKKEPATPPPAEIAVLGDMTMAEVRQALLDEIGTWKRWHSGAAADQALWAKLRESGHDDEDGFDLSRRVDHVGHEALTALAKEGRIQCSEGPGNWNNSYAPLGVDRADEGGPDEPRPPRAKKASKKPAGKKVAGPGKKAHAKAEMPENYLAELATNIAAHLRQAGKDRLHINDLAKVLGKTPAHIEAAANGDKRLDVRRERLKPTGALQKLVYLSEEPRPEPSPVTAPTPQTSRQELIRDAVLAELKHNVATFGELLTNSMRASVGMGQGMPQPNELREALAALCEEKKTVWDEAKKVYRLSPPPPPEPKKAKGKKAPAAPKPTVTVGEAMSKMLAEVSVHDWQQARAEVCEKIAERGGVSVSVGPLLLKINCDSNLLTPVLELLDAAGAISLGRKGSSPAVVTPSAAVGDGEIDSDMQALTRRYVRDLVDDRHEPPTASELSESLELPAALIDSVLIELRAAQELLCDREGRWSVRSPKASAAARTAPLFADVEPAPAVDGLEPEGDES